MSHHKASNNASLSNTQKGRIILQALLQFMHLAICTFVQTLLLIANKSSQYCDNHLWLYTYLYNCPLQDGEGTLPSSTYYLT